jgi:hypothetical protein
MPSAVGSKTSSSDTAAVRMARCSRSASSSSWAPSVSTGKDENGCSRAPVNNVFRLIPVTSATRA